MKIPSLFKHEQDQPLTAKQRSGNSAEDRALKLLKKAGLSLVQRNYRCRLGEIDLIMKEADTLVFVEVRFRKKSAYGSALETVTSRKQAKIRRAAQQFIADKKPGNHLTMRFDVVGMDDNDSQWIKGAFY